MEALRRDVEALAAIERGSASAGEREAAALLARRLAEAGAVGVELQPFRYQHSFGHAHALHFGAAALGRAAAAAALVSFEREYSGRSQWLRRWLPAGDGANVLATVPPSGAPDRTLVLVAHHDAANTGLLWDPRLAGGGRERGRASFALPAELAMAAIAFGPRRLRRPARAVLALAAGLSLEVTRGEVVPGASDNATGAAAVVALAARLAREPLERTRTLVVLTGAEESGMGGMAAWLRERGGALDPGSTLVLGLDTLGAGEPIVCSAEGPLASIAYRPRDLAWADRGARRAELQAPRRFRIGGWTDPVLARLAGLPAISLLSLRGNGFTDYHLPTDTPERVDWGSVESCVSLAEGSARSFDSAATQASCAVTS